MRQLTQQEIDNAPEWADSYFENIIGDMWYFDSKTGRSKSVDTSSEVESLDSCHYAYRQSKPITRKEFDIMAWHNQRKDIIKPCIEINGDNEISVDGEIDREYSIAFAKYFKLTGEDLK